MTNIHHETPSVNPLVQACLAPVRKRSGSSEVLRPGEMFSEGRRDTDYTALAGFFRSRGASEEDIAQYLCAIDTTIPVPHGADNISRISNSIARYDVKPDAFTHDSFAKLLAEQLANTVLYCEGYGFLIYQHGQWQRDAEGLNVMHLVRQIVDKVRAQVEQMKAGLDSDALKKVRKAAKKLESANFLRESIKLLKTDPAIRITFGKLDNKKHLLNLANGTFDLEKFQLQPFNPADHLTFKLDFDYQPDADCPQFRKFLSEILSDDVARYVLRVIGYSLLGSGREQRFFIFQGKGKNGKSTLVSY